MTTVDGLPDANSSPDTDSSQVPNSSPDGNASPVSVCRNGHVNAAGAAFCQTCGAPLAAGSLGPTTRKARPVGVIAVGVVALVAVIALGAFALAPKGETIRGVLTLFGFDNSTGSWSECSGTGGYSDLSAGGNVRITDGNGDTIGASSLRNITEADLPTMVQMDKAPGNLFGLKSTDDPGAVVELRQFLSDSNSLACFLWWEASGVPDTGFYGVEVTHRGTLDYTHDQLAGNGWIISSTIGDN